MSKRFKIVIWIKELDTDFQKLHQMYNDYGWTYYHAAHEIAPKTGRHHLDGYYEMDNSRKLTTEIKKFAKTFGQGFGDIQPAEGGWKENCNYSEKEGRRFETFGDPAQGQDTRTDLKKVATDIQNGTYTCDDICLDNPELYHQYARTFTKMEDIMLRRKFRTEMTTCDWYVGPTGVGKSHRAFNGYQPLTHYLWKDDKGWQDGYIGQPTVIINDFRGSIPYNELLQLIDKWPYFVSRRQREPAPFISKHIIITSSLRPEQVYHRRDDEDKIEQLLRRVNIITIEDPGHSWRGEGLINHPKF